MGFGGAEYRISGRVTDGGGNSILGVSVSAGAAGSATTDGSGAYTISGLAAGTYTLTPSKPGYFFSPASLPVIVPPSATGVDFTAAPITYAVSGTVKDFGGAGIPDVTISDGAGHTAATGEDGRYTLSGLVAGTYTLTPLRSGYTFSPPSHPVNVPPDATVDFVGTQVLSISHIEVTQAIQCLDNPNCFGDPASSATSQQLYDQYCGVSNPNCNNAVPLIAGKPTFVWVFVECSQDCDALANGARLRGYGASGELGTALSPHWGFVYGSGLGEQRKDLRKTLNFTLPAEWSSGIITLTADVAGVQDSEVAAFREVLSSAGGHCAHTLYLRRRR